VKSTAAGFHFAFPRLLMGVDVYNPLDHDVTVKMRAPELREVTFQVKAGELQRFKTGWMNRASGVTFESPELGALRFDNLAYSLYYWTRLDWSE